MQNNQFPTQTPAELKDNPNIEIVISYHDITDVLRKFN
jgi:hypothetical protein